MRIIILISGAKGAGKTTTANMIQEIYPEAKILALADKLKDVCASILRIDRYTFDEPTLKEQKLATPIKLTIFQLKKIVEAFSLSVDPVGSLMEHCDVELLSPRHVLQYIGSEVLRSLEPDIHCLHLTQHIMDSGFYIISDIRFKNEYTFFKYNYKNECYPWFIHRSVAELASAQDGHISERGMGSLAKLSRIINNNGTLDELKERVMEALEDVFKVATGLK